MWVEHKASWQYVHHRRGMWTCKLVLSNVGRMESLDISQFKRVVPLVSDSLCSYRQDWWMDKQGRILIILYQPYKSFAWLFRKTFYCNFMCLFLGTFASHCLWLFFEHLDFTISKVESQKSPAPWNLLNSYFRISDSLNSNFLNIFWAHLVNSILDKDLVNGILDKELDLVGNFWYDVTSYLPSISNMM